MAKRVKRDPSKPKSNRGAPTLYRAEYVDQVYRLCLLGATDVEIAGVLGVNQDTLNRWKKDHPEMYESMKRGKTLADAEIAHSLYHRGKGYSHSAVKIFMPAGAKEPVYADYTEHYPPDTAAASLWLRNRQPDRWRDKREVEHGGSLEHRLASMGDAERMSWALEQSLRARRLLEAPMIEHDDEEAANG